MAFPIRSSKATGLSGGEIEADEDEGGKHLEVLIDGGFSLSVLSSESFSSTLFAVLPANGKYNFASR